MTTNKGTPSMGGGGGGGRVVDAKRNGPMKGKITVLQSLHRLPQQT